MYVAVESSTISFHFEHTRLSHYERIWRVARDIDPNALGLQIVANGVDAALASDSGSLVTAEWRHIAHGAIGVHPHGPCFQTLGHHQRATNALRPHTRGEAVHSVVGDPNRLLFVIEWNYRQHRTEDLFVRDQQLRVHGGKNCRLDKPAQPAFLGLVWDGAQTADRAFLLRDAYIIQDFFVLRPRGDGTNLCR